MQRGRTYSDAIKSDQSRVAMTDDCEHFLRAQCGINLKIAKRTKDKMPNAIRRAEAGNRGNIDVDICFSINVLQSQGAAKKAGNVWHFMGHFLLSFDWTLARKLPRCSQTAKCGRGTPEATSPAAARRGVRARRTRPGILARRRARKPREELGRPLGRPGCVSRGAVRRC